VLDTFSVLVRRPYQEISLENVVATRFFNINMFPGKDCLDGYFCMPMIGCGDADRVNCGIIQNTPVVLLLFDREVTGQHFQREAALIGIDIADGYHAAIRPDTGELFAMASPLPTGTDDRMANLRVG
jgi:hypothetical protein